MCCATGASAHCRPASYRPIPRRASPYICSRICNFEVEPESLPGTPRNRVAALDGLCERATQLLGVSGAEIGSRGLRAPVLDARAVVGHLAVCHYSLSVTAVARHLHVSRQSIARGLERAADTFARRRCTPADFIGD